MDKPIDEIMIKEFYWKLKVDRLGNMTIESSQNGK
jgi:hypothetical protein